MNGNLKPGAFAVARIGARPVLSGFVDAIHQEFWQDQSRMSLSLRDRTGDLVDCAASIDGPFEFPNATLEPLLPNILAPFGIAVRFIESPSNNPCLSHPVRGERHANFIKPHGVKTLENILVFTMCGQAPVLLNQAFYTFKARDNAFFTRSATSGLLRFNFYAKYGEKRIIFICKIRLSQIKRAGGIRAESNKKLRFCNRSFLRNLNSFNVDKKKVDKPQAAMELEALRTDLLI